MTVLDLKLRRDLAGVKTTMVAILLVIAVGIACFVGMASVYVNLDAAKRDYYARCRMADFWIDLKKAPLSELSRVAEVPGVAEVQPRIVFRATVDLPDVARPLVGQVISLSGTDSTTINGIVMSRGTGFSDGRLEEVIVNDKFAQARGILPGQTIHVVLNDRRQELHVVGTAISSEFVYLIGPGGLVPDPDNYGVFYVKQRFAEEVLDFDGACNQIVGLLTPEARDRPAAVLDAIEQLLAPYGVFSSTARAEQASHQILEGELAQLRSSAVIMPAIFLIVAVLVLNILMARLAEQQRVTVGTLKALGYSDAMVMRHYLNFGLITGIAGGLAGLAAGWGMAEGTTISYRMWFEFPRLDNRLVPGVYGAAMVISMVFAMLGTARGVRSIVRLSPAEAMRAKPPVEAGAVLLERFRGLWKRLGFRWQMVVRSVLRHKLRTAAGVFAAMMGSALMFTTFYFTGSIQYLIDFEFEKVLLSDYELSFREDRDGGAVLEAQRLPAVDLAEPLLAVPCEFVNGHRTKRSAIVGVPQDARLTVARSADGRPVTIPASGLLMSRRLARLLEVEAGDDVTLVPIKGLREPARVVVASIVDGFVGMSTYADYDWLNGIVGEADAVSAVRLASRTDARSRLDFFGAIKEVPIIQGVGDRAEAKQKLVTTLLDVLRYSIGVLVAMAGVIFFGSILTTSLIAIAERRREVATFLVMGYDLRQIGGIFLRESMLVNVIGTLLGLPLGLWLSLVLIEFNDRDAYRLPAVASPASYVVTVVLAVLFVLAAHWFVHRAIRRLDWLEALNAKE